MTNVPASPLDKELRPPAHLADILARVAALHRDEVAPREQALQERLADESKYLDVDGRLHPEIIAARREIMRAETLYGADEAVINGFATQTDSAKAAAAAAFAAGRGGGGGAA